MLLRDWLTKRPSPASLTLDGQPLTVPAGRKRWSVLADTIHAAAKPGAKLVAFDDKGSVLRATTYQPDDDQDDEEEAPAPAGESDLATFARLLSEATEKVMARDEAMFSRVFDAQNQMMQTFASRLSSLENAWHKQVVESAKVQAAMIEMAAAQASEQQPDLLTTMAAQFAAGQLTAGSPPDTKSNGKK